MSDTATLSRSSLSELYAQVAAIGRVVDAEKTAAIYAPLAERPPYKNVTVARDLKYGADRLQALDVFAPEAAGRARPVLIYVHGGGFVAGDKCEAGSPFYDNIMLWAAKNKIVGVNINYRLAPAAPWPAGAQDTGAAVRWVGESIAAYGGDPARVFLMGHSAGANHVANYVAHPEFHGPEGVRIAGAVLLSAGSYDLTLVDKLEERFKQYFGEDRSLYAERSAVNGLVASDVPILLATSEFNLPNHFIQYNALREKLSQRKRGSLRAFIPPHHSHISEVYAINTGDETFTGPLREFIETGK